jgi:hypothetical protein
MVNWRLGYFLSYFKGLSSQDQQKTFRRRLITFKVTGTAGVVDTRGTDVNDTGGKFAPVSMTLVANNGNNIRLLTP